MNRKAFQGTPDAVAPDSHFRDLGRSLGAPCIVPNEPTKSFTAGEEQENRIEGVAVPLDAMLKTLERKPKSQE